MNTASPIGHCDPAELAARLDSAKDAQADFVLLDVREDWEREIAQIEPCLAIVMNDVPDHLDEIRSAQGDRDLIVFCHTGKRSMVIARYLEGEGFERIVNLDGGIDGWSQHIHASRHLY